MLEQQPSSSQQDPPRCALARPCICPCIEPPSSLHCVAQASGAQYVAQMHLGHSSTGLPPAWVNTALQRDLIARHFVSSRSHSSSSLCCVSTSSSSSTSSLCSSFLPITHFQPQSSPIYSLRLFGVLLLLINLNPKRNQ